MNTRDLFGPFATILPVVDSPVYCLYRDTINLCYNMKYIGTTLKKFVSFEPLDELSLRPSSSLPLLYFTLASIAESIIIVPAFIVFLLIFGLGDILVRLNSLAFWRLFQGPATGVYPETIPAGTSFEPTQRWVYINGIATGSKIMQQNMQYLYDLFGQPMLGINNRTYGFVGDLLECIVQRSLNYHTKETRQAKAVIKSYLLEDSTRISKVVLIAHSQGGILASHIVDSLLVDSDLSPDHLSKLEIYTFGSAAQRMNNPYTDNSCTKRMIPVMEHFCNEHDMVPSWGALSSSVKGTIEPSITPVQVAGDTDGNVTAASIETIEDIMAQRVDFTFMGKVFNRKGATGHMLNQHYLRCMFGDGPIAPGPKYLDCVVKRLASESPLDVDARYNVEPRVADRSRGEQSVSDVSGLWRYLKPSTPPTVPLTLSMERSQEQTEIVDLMTSPVRE